MSDDARQATTIIAAISTNVITAALAGLAGLIVLFTYLSQTYHIDAWFYGAMIISAGCMVGSVICGGRGTANLAYQVATSTWEVTDDAPYFKAQTWLAYAGIVALAAGAFIAIGSRRTSPPTPEPKVTVKVYPSIRNNFSPHVAVKVRETDTDADHDRLCSYTTWHCLGSG